MAAEVKDLIQSNCGVPKQLWATQLNHIRIALGRWGENLYHKVTF